MSAEHEELIDYEDDTGVPTSHGATGATGAMDAGEDKEKKGYVGIHSTGFRYVGDCGLAVLCLAGTPSI